MRLRPRVRHPPVEAERRELAFQNRRCVQEHARRLHITVHELQRVGIEVEIVGSGVEISFDVQFTVQLRKGQAIGWPRGENADYIFTLGNARPLDQAVQHATTEMLAWLQTDYALDPVGAHILMGQCVEYDLGNMYDPAYTMACKMAKRYLGRGGAS